MEQPAEVLGDFAADSCKTEAEPIVVDGTAVPASSIANDDLQLQVASTTSENLLTSRTTASANAVGQMPLMKTGNPKKRGRKYKGKRRSFTAIKPHASDELCYLSQLLHDQTASTPEKKLPSSPLLQSPASGFERRTWLVGDVAWGRVSGHPWWPCIVAYDSATSLFMREKRYGPTRVGRQYHVLFFGEDREHGWVSDKWLAPFVRHPAFEAAARSNTESISHHRKILRWQDAVKLAEKAVKLERPERIKNFTTLAAAWSVKTKAHPKAKIQQPGKKRLYSQKSKPKECVMDVSDHVGSDLEVQSPPAKKHRRSLSAERKPPGMEKPQQEEVEAGLKSPKRKKSQDSSDSCSCWAHHKKSPGKDPNHASPVVANIVDETATKDEHQTRRKSARLLEELSEQPCSPQKLTTESLVGVNGPTVVTGPVTDTIMLEPMSPKKKKVPTATLR